MGFFRREVVAAVLLICGVFCLALSATSSASSQYVLLQAGGGEVMRMSAYHYVCMLASHLYTCVNL